MVQNEEQSIYKSESSLNSDYIRLTKEKPDESTSYGSNESSRSNEPSRIYKTKEELEEDEL